MNGIQDLPTGLWILLAALFGLFLFVCWVVRRLQDRRAAARLTPDKYIIVDGSNVMHWGGDPSEKVLGRVLEALEGKGLKPIVYFDANVGYKLWDRYTNENATAKKLRLDPRQVFVAPRGVTADEMLLITATETGLRVVTNDRFRDWSVQFPRLGEKRFLVKGEWRQGSVMLRGL